MGLTYLSLRYRLIFALQQSVKCKSVNLCKCLHQRIRNFILYRIIALNESTHLLLTCLLTLLTYYFLSTLSTLCMPRWFHSFQASMHEVPKLQMKHQSEEILRNCTLTWVNLFSSFSVFVRLNQSILYSVCKSLDSTRDNTKTNLPP